MRKMLAKKLEGDSLQCIACHRRCIIPNGSAGFCGVRVNENGSLKLSVYGRPVALWPDPVEKKPLFHYLPGTRSFSIGTVGCNFACDFCQNWDISQAPREAREKDPQHWRDYFQKHIDSCQQWSPERIVKGALESSCKSISFTYNEPTIFTEYALDIMDIAKKHDLRGIYVTNGYETKECWDELGGNIHAANIDLKAFNQKFYSELCHVPDMEHIKDSIIYAKKLGIWVEITTLIVPGWNDNLDELKAAAKWLHSVDPDMPWHITAFHPDYKMKSTKGTAPEILLKAREIGLSEGLAHVYCGNISQSYSEYETTYCPSCNSELIARVGMMVTLNKLKDGKCHRCQTKISGVWK